jgi:DNA replication protein DnaC
VTDIKSGTSCFAISGTPGIGKSLFFIFILHQIISKSAWKPDEWKPDVVEYHNDEASTYYAYKIGSLRVVDIGSRHSE